MPIALSPNSKKPYVCKEDRGLPKEKQTVFYIKEMNFHDLCAFQDAVMEMSNEEEGEVSLRNIARATSHALKLALSPPGWENFTYENGESCEFAKELEADFPSLGVKLQQELIQAAMSINSLSEEEQGNLSSSQE